MDSASVINPRLIPVLDVGTAKSDIATDIDDSAKHVAISVPNLFGLSESMLIDYMKTFNCKPYSAKQLSRWLYQRGVLNFDDMSNLSKALRVQLKDSSAVHMPNFGEMNRSIDGTQKWEVLLNDDAKVETVYIPASKRGTLCISSQAGCVLDCQFCATGAYGFERNLSATEIIAQVWQAKKELNDFGRMPVDRVLTNVVFMGMGEPLLNFNAVATAISVMLSDNGFALASKRITVSTAGVAPMMERVATDCGGVTLAVSLHAADNDLRTELVPLNKKYPIQDVLDGCYAYLGQLRRRGSVTFQYTLIDGVNDSNACARDLAYLLKDVPCKINLIPFNAFPESDYRRSSDERIENFQRILVTAGYIAPVRTTRGNDIAAACGRLVGSIRNRSARVSPVQVT